MVKKESIITISSEEGVEEGGLMNTWNSNGNGE